MAPGRPEFCVNFTGIMQTFYLKGAILGGLALVSFFTAISQVPPGAQGQGRRGFGGQVPSIGHFYGKVVDARNNKGLDGVSVILIQSKFDTVSKKRKDTVVSGMITESKGNFSLENLPIFGNFRLKITAIGYKIYDQKVAFDIKFKPGMDMQ